MKFLNSAHVKKQRVSWSMLLAFALTTLIFTSGIVSATRSGAQASLWALGYNGGLSNPETLYRETVAAYYSDGSRRKYDYIYTLSAVVWDECYVKQNIDPYLAAALIEAESEWRMVSGKPVKVNLPNNRSGVYRAIGLMQVMPFNHPHGEQPLWWPDTNIRYGCLVLARYAAGRTVVDSLKNYNSGPASNHYNWPYIRKIIAHHKNTIDRAEESERSRRSLMRLVNLYR